ncbi:hypothetical protein COI_1137 [Mannheimia haemolytica serotype A2 str. OVINE]|nr:hypothetical protein COI_1137 [Mannheimia haemolytica serotype A2 str. OVINE]
MECHFFTNRLSSSFIGRIQHSCYIARLFTYFSCKVSNISLTHFIN